MADFGYDVSDHSDIDPVFGSSPISTRSSRRPPPRHAGAARLGAEPHAPSSTHGSSSRARRATPRSGTGTSGATAARRAGRRTTGSRRSAARRGRGTRPAASGTSTCSCPSSPTSTGRAPRWSRRCTACCASGSTGASTGSAPTSSTDRQGRGAPRRPARARPHLAHRRLQRRTRAPTSCCAASARLLDEYPGDRDDRWAR